MCYVIYLRQSDNPKKKDFLSIPVQQHAVDKYFSSGVLDHSLILRDYIEKAPALAFSVEYLKANNLLPFNEIENAVILKTYTEIETGARKEKRPELAKAIEFCKANNAILVIAESYQLTSNVQFLTKLRDDKVNFFALDFPIANHLMINEAVSAAEHWFKVRSERSSAAMQTRKLRGLPVGNPQYFTNATRLLGNQTTNAMKKKSADAFALKMFPTI